MCACRARRAAKLLLYFHYYYYYYHYRHYHYRHYRHYPLGPTALGPENFACARRADGRAAAGRSVVFMVTTDTLRDR